ncbi:MAG TPA: hypothetical protein VF123_11535 [Candidatus Sulfotelmatobacter sp.]
MKNLDPDLQHVLQKLGAGLKARCEADRLAKVQAKREQQLLDKLETTLELMGDELEAVIPRTHPMFNLILIEAVTHKVISRLQKDEFQSYIDEGFPKEF